MKDPSLALRTAYYTALNGNITYNNATVGVYDHVPQTVVYPYILLGNQTSIDDSDKEDFGTDHTMLVEIITGYSTGYKGGGFTAADTIGEDVMELIIVSGSHLDLSADGYNVYYTSLVLNENFQENTSTHKIFRKIIRIRHSIQEL